MNDTPRERFQEILESFTTGMLVTQEVDDQLRGRPMHIARIDSDGDLWFSTRVESGKTHDIRQNSDVVVVFQDSGRFLTVSGTATITQDEHRIESLWNESWKVWFPEGKEDPSLALLHIEAQQGEYWDNSWLRGLTYAIKAGRAYWTGETPEISEDTNATVKLS